MGLVAAGGAAGAAAGVAFGFGLPSVLTGPVAAGLGAGVGCTISDAMEQGKSVSIGVSGKEALWTGAIMFGLMMFGDNIPGLNQLSGLSLAAAQGAVAGAAAGLFY